MALTATQIVATACSVAKCPGFTSQGGLYLNLVLKDLWLHRDLKVNRKTQSINVQANSNGPFSLETDYLRTYDLFYLQNNLPYFLQPATMEMYDMQFKDPSISNYPYMYMTDLSAAALVASGANGQLYVYPQSSALLSLTHRYMQSRDDITTPETSSVVPWFTDQDYLIKATAYRLMEITDDERRDKFITDCEAMLRIHLIMAADDEQQIVKSVRLDPWRFNSNRSVRPTKVTD
jgi:hypothetical protein